MEPRGRASADGSGKRTPVRYKFPTPGLSARDTQARSAEEGGSLPAGQETHENTASSKLRNTPAAGRSEAVTTLLLGVFRRLNGVGCGGGGGGGVSLGVRCLDDGRSSGVSGEQGVRSALLERLASPSYSIHDRG